MCSTMNICHIPDPSGHSREARPGPSRMPRIKFLRAHSPKIYLRKCFDSITRMDHPHHYGVPKDVRATPRGIKAWRHAIGYYGLSSDKCNLTDILFLHWASETDGDYAAYLQKLEAPYSDESAISRTSAALRTHEKSFPSQNML